MELIDTTVGSTWEAEDRATVETGPPPLGTAGGPGGAQVAKHEPLFALSQCQGIPCPAGAQQRCWNKRPPPGRARTSPLPWPSQGIASQQHPCLTDLQGYLHKQCPLRPPSFNYTSTWSNKIVKCNVWAWTELAADVYYYFNCLLLLDFLV